MKKKMIWTRCTVSARILEVICRTPAVYIFAWKFLYIVVLISKSCRKVIGVSFVHDLYCTGFCLQVHQSIRTYELAWVDRPMRFTTGTDQLQSIRLVLFPLRYPASTPIRIHFQFLFISLIHSISLVIVFPQKKL